MVSQLASFSLTSFSHVILQVGLDKPAADFLDSLDNDREIGGSIDTVNDYDMESSQLVAKGKRLTPDIYLLKLALGAIDSDYDSLD